MARPRKQQQQQQQQHVLLYLHVEDWNLLHETLSMDAKSAAFDRPLRDRISKALARVVECDHQHDVEIKIPGFSLAATTVRKVWATLFVDGSGNGYYRAQKPRGWGGHP